LGVVGFHPAALPENRGRHPLIWALVLGLEETASTFFFMDEGADSGDLLSQRRISIEPADDAGSLYARITEVAMCQIREFVPLLES
jgi:methionyl-tRNA formyltransferase